VSRELDTDSRHVARFLGALQGGRDRLVRTLYNELIRAGARSATPFLNLSASPFRIHGPRGVREFAGAVSLGVCVTPPAGEPFEAFVEVLWDEGGWTLQTEAWVDCEEGARLIQSSAERSATTLDECLGHLEAALEELSPIALSLARGA
jgi:hypothetical protein